MSALLNDPREQAYPICATSSLLESQPTTENISRRAVLKRTATLGLLGCVSVLLAACGSDLNGPGGSNVSSTPGTNDNSNSDDSSSSDDDNSNSDDDNSNSSSSSSSSSSSDDSGGDDGGDDGD